MTCDNSTDDFFVKEALACEELQLLEAGYERSGVYLVAKTAAGTHHIPDIWRAGSTAQERARLFEAIRTEGIIKTPSKGFFTTGCDSLDDFIVKEALACEEQQLLKDGYERSGIYLVAKTAAGTHHIPDIWRAGSTAQERARLFEAIHTEGIVKPPPPRIALLQNR